MLSNRLNAISKAVRLDESVADIGTDHGLIPRDLINKGLTGKLILTDINQKPLDRAKDLFQESGLTKKADFRLGPGLNPLEAKEVNQLIIAGMGGEMIARILGENLEKSHSFDYFILQPMTQVDSLREFLVQNNFKILSDCIIKDESERKERYFNLLLVENGTTGIKDNNEYLFGIKEVVKVDKNYLDYLKYELNRYGNYIRQMQNSTNEKTQLRRLEYERRFNFLKEYYESLANNTVN